MEDQQQFAETVLLTVWQWLQTISVSLQLSPQRGITQSMPVVRAKHTHQAIPTQPSFLLRMFPVSLPQIWHAEPLSLLFPPVIMIVCGAAGGGGGGGK